MSLILQKHNAGGLDGFNAISQPPFSRSLAQQTTHARAGYKLAQQDELLIIQ
jgi:hypothetical protein